jgi:hypothetical protein
MADAHTMTIESSNAHAGTKPTDHDIPEHNPLPAFPNALHLVGECLQVGVLSIDPRAQVRWTDAQGQVALRWLPTLRHVAVREGDHVLLVQPLGCPLPVVIGVINGFSMRPESQHPVVYSLALLPDEAITVTDHEGQPLLQLCRSANGLRIRPCSPDLDLRVPGALHISADRVAIQADRGNLYLRASDSVVAEGELIKLN